ncbi:MAG: hypothetical protein R2748_11455 [Bryobacterales bacterium]
MAGFAPALAPMDVISLLVPTAYVAALSWAAGGDFLRAQLVKDLECDPPALLEGLWQQISLPTLCLIGALVLRLMIHVKGLLLTALFVSAVLALLQLRARPSWRMRH